MKKSNSSEFMGTKKLFPLLMQMSIPSIVGMMVASLYNIVDTIFIGWGAGAIAIGGLMIGFPLQMIVMSFAQMIAIGAASIISRKLGEEKPDEAATTLGTAYTSIIIISVIMVGLIFIFGEDLLAVFGASDVTMVYAKDYMYTVAFGFPFFSISIAGSNLIRSEGNAKMAMNTMLVGLVLNIALDPVFIFVFDMGLKGAALATVISQIISAGWIFTFYAKHMNLVKLKKDNLKINWSQLGRMMYLGLPNFIQSAGMSIMIVIMNKILSFYSGDLGIIVYGITVKIMSLVIQPVVGIAQGFQPIVGYNFGAKKYDRVKKIVIIASVSATVVSGVFAVVVQLFPYALINIFTGEKEVITSGGDALRILASFVILLGVQVIFSIYFQAVGKGTMALFLGVSRRFLIMIPLVMVLPKYYGVTGVWLSFPVSDILSSVITAYFLIRELKHLDDKHNDSLELAKSYS